MGQYYLPVNLIKKEYLFSHDFNNGLKLMEHSWVGNKFVGAVARLLATRWSGDPITWAGDYEDDLVIKDNQVQGVNRFFKPTIKELDLINEEVGINIYHLTMETGTRLENKLTIYNLIEQTSSKPQDETNTKALVNSDDHNIQPNYFINLDKKEFVDITTMPKFTVTYFAGYDWETENIIREVSDPVQIHPLPLLLASSNGRGGGDYAEDFPGQEFVGSWCGDHIKAVYKRPEDYKEIKPNFCEQCEQKVRKD